MILLGLLYVSLYLNRHIQKLNVVSSELREFVLKCIYCSPIGSFWSCRQIVFLMGRKRMLKDQVLLNSQTLWSDPPLMFQEHHACCMTLNVVSSKLRVCVLKCIYCSPVGSFWSRRQIAFLMGRKRMLKHQVLSNSQTLQLDSSLVSCNQSRSQHQKYESIIIQYLQSKLHTFVEKFVHIINFKNHKFQILNSSSLETS